jgi:hypothetical protein
MTEQDDDRMGRPDGHRYDSPEPADVTSSKKWAYLVLGLLVLLLLVLVATGTVPVFPGGA